VPQTFRAHCKSFCCFRSHFRALLQFCILLLYALYLHYAQFCVFCTCCIRYLFLHYNAFSHVHYHCIRYYAYHIIFIHLAFAAFCVCIIRLHSRHIQHMSHSSSVAFKGPSAFICISCPFPASFSRGDAGPSLA
jgi:hypothetical protein